MRPELKALNAHLAKKRKEKKQADILIEEMEIEHETVPYIDGEVWKAQIAIGKIERQIWNGYSL